MARRNRKTPPVVSEADRNEMRDHLRQALAVLDGECINFMALRMCVFSQRDALRMAHGILQG